MMQIDRIPVDSITLRIDKNYLRFEGDCWYIHDMQADTYIRVKDSEILEDLYLKTLDGN